MPPVGQVFLYTDCRSSQMAKVYLVRDGTFIHELRRRAEIKVYIHYADTISKELNTQVDILTLSTTRLYRE